MGDFNIELLKFTKNDNTNNFMDVMFSSSFYPVISKPTRITKSTATLIDNIFFNSCDTKFRTGLLFTDLSDHLSIFLLTNIKHQIENKSRNNKKIRKVTDQAISSLCQELDKTDFSVYACTNNPALSDEINENL